MCKISTLYEVRSDENQQNILSHLSLLYVWRRIYCEAVALKCKHANREEVSKFAFLCVRCEVRKKNWGAECALLCFHVWSTQRIPIATLFTAVRLLCWLSEIECGSGKITNWHWLRAWNLLLSHTLCGPHAPKLGFPQLSRSTSTYLAAAVKVGFNKKISKTLNHPTLLFLLKMLNLEIRNVTLLLR